MIGTIGGSYEHTNEHSISIKCSEFLEKVSEWKLLKKYSAAWG
jgi:hypothetical protein